MLKSFHSALPARNWFSKTQKTYLDAARQFVACLEEFPGGVPWRSSKVVGTSRKPPPLPIQRQFKLRSLLRFAEEELKHQEFFRRSVSLFGQGFGSECGLIPGREEVAKVACARRIGP